MANIPPIQRPRSQRSVVRPERRWNGISWWFSLLFVVGLLAWGATLVFDIGGDGSGNESSETLEVTVVDADTTEPIQGAVSPSGNEVETTDAAGMAELDLSARTRDDHDRG